MTALEKAWYKPLGWSVLLLPLAWLFQVIASIRKCGLQCRYQGRGYGVPVVVIGNISVGGTGKTPLIIALANALIEQGVRPGVVSRGYGGSGVGTAGRVGHSQPMSVTANSAAEQSGDEALLIARRTGCPVVVCADRVAAIHHLLAEYSVDIILSDDGLQHYRMHRDLEIAVIDGVRGLGNRLCLPAGPLREPPRRLRSVDVVVINGGSGNLVSSVVTNVVSKVVSKVVSSRDVAEHTPVCQMTLRPDKFVNLSSGKTLGLEAWPRGQAVHAVAGIGNPQRFFDLLIELGLVPRLHRFSDHHRFTVEDIRFDDDLPVIMTAKDAVKCESWADARCWFLEVAALPPAELVQSICNKLD